METVIQRTIVTVELCQRGELLVREEIGRQGGEIAGGGLGVSLTSRAIESHDQDRATPGLLRLGTSGYPSNRVVHGGTPRKRKGAIEYMERIAQWLPVQALREDNCVRLALGEIVLNDRCGTGCSINHSTADLHGARTI